MANKEPLIIAKLTKKFFMQLPEGLYLVSNLYPNPMQSLFEEEISPSTVRDQQWKKIVLAGVHQRFCCIYQNREEYVAWLTQANYDSSKSKKKRRLAH